MTQFGARSALLVALAGVWVATATPAHADVSGDILSITALEDRRESGPALIRFLGAASEDVRARAALAVGRIGRTEDVSDLAARLADDSARVRRMAAFGLGEIGDSTAAQPLVDLLQSGRESDAAVREVAVQALGKTRQGVDACRAALADESPRVRGAALIAAWQIPIPDVLDAVIAAMEDHDAEVRWRAAYALMRLAGARASGRTPITAVPGLTWDERDRAEAVLRRLVSDVDARVRMSAVRGLRSFGSDVATATLTSVAADEDWRVRVEAVRALAANVRVRPDTDDGESEEPAPEPRRVGLTFLDGYLEDDNPNVRITAIEALATVGEDADALPRLRPLLESPTPRIAVVALESLTARWQAADSSSADRLDDIESTILRARNREWPVQAATIGAAALLPPERRRPILERLLSGDGRVIKLAVAPLLTLLAEQGDAPSLMARLEPTLGSFRTHEDPMVRLMAVDTLGELFAADSVYAPTEADRRALDDVLTKTYRESNGDDETDLREAAVSVAANWPDRDACRELVRSATNDPNYVVRLRAIAAATDAGIEPARSVAEPVDTGRSAKDYAPILEWAKTGHVAVIETDAGTITATLFTRDAPLTCWNFARLANAGFYDAGRWHRVVPDFVVQDGCPRGDGWGGPPWQIRCEINEHPYDTGALGMALSGKDTGGSQFFITHSPQPHLDGGYTVFGHVVTGQDVADAVVQGNGIRSIRVLDGQP